MSYSLRNVRHRPHDNRDLSILREADWLFQLCGRKWRDPESGKYYGTETALIIQRQRVKGLADAQ